MRAKVRRQVELTSLYDDLAKAASAHPGAQLRQPGPGRARAGPGRTKGTDLYVFERLHFASAAAP